MSIAYIPSNSNEIYFENCTHGTSVTFRMYDVPWFF